MKSVQRHQARCVIWRSADDVVPAALRKALQDRGLWFTECDTASWATAEACRLNTMDDCTPVILLLLAPASLPDADAVLRTCLKFAPQVSHWVYDEDATPKLRARVPEVKGCAAQTPSLQSWSVVSDGEGADNPSSGCKSGEDSRSILSFDELDALKHPEQAGDQPS